MTSPRILLRAWQVPPLKQLGQHFLTDGATAAAIVHRAGILPQERVLEIGAGLGALTHHLSRSADRVYAVEKDKRIARLLAAELTAARSDNVVLINADVLKVDIRRLAAGPEGRLVAVGNLPYNISSQILLQLIQERACLKKAVLMFQKELAQRLMAQTGGKDYGRLSVLLQYCARVRPLMDIKAACFHPRPKIDSQVLEITFKKHIQPAARDETFFIAVIKAAFSKRRKTLKNALSASPLPVDAATAVRVLTESGIDPARRAETLDVAAFVALSNRLYPLCRP